MIVRNKSTLSATLGIGLMLAAGGSAAAADQAPYKFLFLAQQTGPNGSIGVSMRVAAQIAVDEVNAAGGVDGKHKLAMDIQDDQGTNSTAVQAVRTAAAGGVKIVLGMWSSPICLAVAPVMDQLGGLTIGATCSVDQLVGPNRVAKSFFGIASHNTQMVTAAAALIHKLQPGITTADAVGYDYVTSRQEETETLKSLGQLGQTVTLRHDYWVPLSSVDFSSQVAALARTVDAPQPTTILALLTYGAGTLGFLKQQAPFDLVGKYPMTITLGGYYEPAGTLGGTSPSVWNIYDYIWTASDSADNRQFIASYRKASPSGLLPGSWAWQAYTGVKVLAAAYDKAKTDNPVAVGKAMETVSVDTPTGPATMDAESHQLRIPVVAFLSVGDPKAPDTLRVLRYALIHPEGPIEDVKVDVEDVPANLSPPK